MRQIVDALRYLHFNKIIHRDLKLDNILVNFPTDYDKQSLNMKSCQVKIIDFGFATVLNKEFTNTILGTAPNMDPKILGQLTTGVKNEGYNESVDIWSLGTLCYEMVVGCSPFRAQNVKDLYQKVQKGNYIMPSTLSDEIVSFIDSMLQQDNNKRSTAEQLMTHKFLVNPVNTFHAVNVKKIKASYLPNGLLNMKSKQPEVIQTDMYNYWGILTQPELYYGNAQQVIPAQVQPQPQPKIQPKMQMQNVQPQYVATKPQQNVYYNQPQVNDANYY
jgi:serine/threonine protein kinase